MIVLLGPQDPIVEWVAKRLGSEWVSGEARGIAIARPDRRIVAGAAFTDYNGRNISAHIVIEDTAATLLLLEMIGGYVFEQLRCSRLTLVADSSNLKAVRLHERLGAVREGTLVGAGKSGDDILISRLTPDAMVWQRLKKRWRRKFDRASLQHRKV